VNKIQSSNSIKDWKDLETRVLALFLNLGFEAKHNVKIRGVRSTHTVDVLAVSEFGGLRFQVIVECKYWKTKVKKTQVAALYSIVSDIGAEKGVIISKVGFQTGAKKFARKSNIELYTYEQFTEKTVKEIEKWLRHKCFDLLTMMKSPYYKFTEKFHEKAHQMDTMWHPSELGHDFSRGIVIFESKLDFFETKEFPSYYVKNPLVNEKLESDWPDRIEVNNKIEYLKLMFDNIIKFKQSSDIYHDEIYAE